MIEKRVRFIGAIDRVDYYKKLVSDYVEMAIPEERKRCTNKKNVTLHSMCAKAKSEHIELRKTCCVILRFIGEIYGKNNKDFGSFLKVYNGIVGQVGLLSGLVARLLYIEIPAEHYETAILYNIKKLEERKNYLHMIIKEYINMTPLADYCKTLPEGVTIFDDIWEHIEKVLSAVNLSSVSEARERYLERMKKAEEERAAEKLKSLQNKRSVADDYATKFSNDLYKRYTYVKTMAEGTRNAIYRNCKDIKNPKIYVLVNVVSANQVGKTPPVRFLGEDGTITSAITKAKVFSNDESIPIEITKLYDSCKYGFAELMLS